MSEWGVMPDEAIAQLRRIEWDNRSNRRARIGGLRPWPVEVLLRPPTGPKADADLPRLQAFSEAWRAFKPAHLVCFRELRLRGYGAGAMPIPERLVIPDLESLCVLLGGEAKAYMDAAHNRVMRLTQIDARLHRPAVSALTRLAELEDSEFAELVRLLPQLQPGIGKGLYLRALPLREVGTKFIETRDLLLSALLAAVHDPAPADVGGLAAWLGVRRKPVGTLLVRPLCADTQAQMHGLSALWVSGSDLMQSRLPGQRLLIVENEQAAFAVPALAQTICIGGAGRELNWLAAEWVKGRRVAYWGDIDTYGYRLLEDARGLMPNLESLLMDLSTIEAHRELFSRESRSCEERIGDRLTPAERAAFEWVRRQPTDRNRLEHEKLHRDWVAKGLAEWGSRAR